ncbi:60S ribosomal protein L18a-2 [Morus notabilis]|uniref:60S ribosomal protein L18a-2 n=1 Tax=Morus notabilis TaxID=981085 RepID=W9S1K5_9ROSA|nr:60S ribosomal protein L18a-2 [Morus notabilis]
MLMRLCDDDDLRRREKKWKAAGRRKWREMEEDEEKENPKSIIDDGFRIGFQANAGAKGSNLNTTRGISRDRTEKKMKAGSAAKLIVDALLQRFLPSLAAVSRPLKHSESPIGANDASTVQRKVRAKLVSQVEYPSLADLRRLLLDLVAQLLVALSRIRTKSSIRLVSQTEYHNMYKEFYDTTLNGAMEQMYNEMASRHIVRFSCIQIIKTATAPAKLCKRESTKQFHNSKISFHWCTRRSGHQLGN